MERYINLLKKAGVELYRITKRKNSSVELFFIKKKLDMRRMKEVEKYHIDMFIDKDGKRAVGTVDFFAGMSDEEILKLIEEAKYSALFALNKFYELAKKTVSDTVVLESTLNNGTLSEVADKFVEAAYSVDNDKEAFINSLELFVKEDYVRIISSYGTDVSYVKRSVTGEYVAQCKEPQDVETYQGFDFDSLALDDMKALMKETLMITKDRAKATEMPKNGNTDIVISGKYMKTLMEFFVKKAYASYVYQKYSEYEVGKRVQGDEIKGDILNVKFVPDVPFNDEGIEMKERDFINDGTLMLLHGGERFSYYMGVEHVGAYEGVRIPKGTIEMEKMFERPCLHVVNFSDFQVDALSGNFGGEIRLAYYYDGKGNVTPVTGGSINGIMFDAQKDMHFSKEMQELANYSGPQAVLLKDIPVAGC